MKTYFDERQRLHHPQREMHNGDWTAHVETHVRADSICAAIGPLDRPADYGMAPLLAVHDAAYLEFLKTAFAEWRAAGRPGEAIGYSWPVVRRRPLDLDRIEAKLGRFSYDAGTPIGEETWTSAYWAAQCAVAAAEDLHAGARRAFALCRPPGHHAGRDYLGGYCYLNNAAIAAEHLIRSGSRRVAVLDVDYHHGNGTQDIFYARGDVGFVSLHGDPRTEYPFFWGHADERGEGGGTGANLNLPLPRGTDAPRYLGALEQGCAEISRWEPDHLVVSFGADTFAEDPISNFAIRTPEFAAIGARIAALDLPTAVVMEGGYASEALGRNVATFLNGLGEG
ncbi:histone deacetylase family protein [Pacificimonas flava]|uniref:Histone deacetylase superfamily n=1 Tax=Pacificimonas flava TaxID=1234595 RepID=M2TDN1_9SPHN|nr:histone deacetylase superfamily [Pacificimonas flava]